MENPFQENETKRPTLLTVLCILTFIGSGWAVISNLTSLFTADIAAEQVEQSFEMMEQMEANGGNSFLSGLMNSSREVLPYLKPIAGINIVLALLSLFGAFLMFRLKKTGFYLYTGAQILMLFVTPAFTGFSGMILFSLVFAAVFAAVFIILYSLNLKYMK